MTLYAVEGVSTQGNETVLFVPRPAGFADPTHPAVTELNASTVLNVGYALRGFAPNAEQGSTPDVRLASKDEFENPGRVKRSIDDITYVYDPQAAAATASNIHYEKFTQGSKWWAVDRRGLDAAGASAVGNKVDIYPVEMGAQRPVPVDPSSEGGKFEIVQKPFVVGPVLRDVAVVAGP